MHNISSKALGLESPSNRHIKAIITSDPSLHLGPSCDIPVNMLGAGTKTNLNLTFKVLEDAIPYQKLNSKISLLLTPPDLSELCSIQQYELSLQVANTYRYNPQANVLLVTNFHTTADDVNPWNLICDQLNLKIDIFNISLHGRLETPDSGKPRNVFDLYSGKTIVLLGDSFPYFERGQRNALDIVDGDDFGRSGGTSLIAWRLPNPHQSMHIPRLLYRGSYPNVIRFTTIKKLVNAVVKTKNERTFYQTRFICTPKRAYSERCKSKGHRAAFELQRRIPDVRFVILWSETVQIFPCLPYDDAKFLIARGKSRFDEVVGFCMLLSLPFLTRLDMLWDQFRQHVGNERLIAVVQYDVIIELSRFTNLDAPWPDNISEKQMANCLKRLEAFLLYKPTCQFSPSSVGQVAALLGNLMLVADCSFGSWPRSLTFATRRKKLCSKLKQMIGVFLRAHYGKSPVLQQFSKYVKEHSKILKSEKLANRKQKVLQRVVGEMGVRVDSIFTAPEILDVELMGNIVRNEKQVDIGKHKDQLRQDLAHAKQLVRSMSGRNTSVKIDNKEDV